ncbi:MAG: hypothetical protein QF464_07090, partial [Myxococcota bacterium]|nr:hypothetical protein [Myxococcota bacterium]
MRADSVRLFLTFVLALTLLGCSDTATTTITPSVIASDQTPACDEDASDPDAPELCSAASTIVVDQVTAAEDGWIVIHADDGGKYGAVLGQTAVESGTSNNVKVTLSRTCADGETLHAML